jgi:glycosyltransferase involved in cell wall biosynthesis
MRMRIAVIMPTCNGSKYLGETLRSIQGQTRLPDELVVSDDASADVTLQILESFAANAPFPVRVLSHIPSGITDNYLNALAHVSVDICVVADQDDVWVANRLEAVEEFFTANPLASLMCADSVIVDHQLQPTGRTLRGDIAASRALASKINQGDDLAQYLQGGLPLLAHTLSFRCSLIPALLAKPRDIGHWWFEEWVACVALCAGRLGLVPDALTLYRQHPGQTAGASAGKQGVVLNKGSKYAGRLRKLRYCLQLLSGRELRDAFDDQERARRAQLLADYVAFLEQRERAGGPSRQQAVAAAMRLQLTGSYRRFAQGWRSFGLDLLSALRK